MVGTFPTPPGEKLVRATPAPISCQRLSLLADGCVRLGGWCAQPDGCVIPNGSFDRNINRLGSKKADKLKGYGTCEYDEYIVYKKSQAKMRYAVVVKFGDKPRGGAAAAAVDLTGG